jgi:large subunit ribosomal protein L3
MGHSILGRKLGVTQVWGPEGDRLSVTIVECGPCVVTAKKTVEGKDGYNAVQFAYEAVPERKLTKPERGVFKKIGAEPHRHLREFRLNEKELAEYEIGQSVSIEHMQVGNFVDATGTSKGRGYTGVMKRYGYHGAKQTHGAHEAYRHAGTGGQGSATPARVPKGMKRPGQHGNARTTIQNLMIVQVDAEHNLVFVQGGIPGPNGGLVHLSTAIKTPDA